jgi:hypothetical protein
MILREKWVINGSKEENKKYKDNKLYEIMKDRDNIYFYEPLVIKTINNPEKKHYTLNEFPNITKIMNYKPTNNILKHLKHLKHLDNNMKDDTKAYRFNTIIINDNYTIDKIMLKNGVIIRFNPQGTIVLPYLMKELNIKNVVFVDDIYNGRKIETINHIYAKFLENINKLNKAEKTLNITVDIGEITFNDARLTISVHKQSIAGTVAGQVILYGKKSVYEEYDKKNARDIKEWSRLRLLVKDRLEALLETKNNKIAEYSKKSRSEFIKWLLGLFDNGQRQQSIAKIQIILEEIPVFTPKGITEWYANTLLHTKYDYINNLSDNFVDNGNELLFTQYLIKKNIPNNILYYHEANPNIIYDNSNDIAINYENIHNDKKGRDSGSSQSSRKSNKAAKVSIKIPKMFEGDPKDLNSKWTKYKKKIWWQLKYIKNDYTADNIIELFNYLKALDNDIVNEYDDIIKKTFKYYELEFNKNINDVPDTKKIKDIFRDPHFYTTYLNAMNSINNTKKTFKTLELFLTTYFYNSSTIERFSILNNIKNLATYTYHPNENTFFHISKVLNISILIIHNRAEYGKAVNLSKRADEKDLSITTSIYKADNNELDRPLLILYKKNDKTHLSYYIVRNVNHDNFIYTELNNSPEEIKERIISTQKSKSYSSSSTQTSDI